MVLTWYIEGVRPGKYGVAKPFYFPFMPSYWLKGHSACPRGGGARHVTLQEEEETAELTSICECVCVCVCVCVSYYSRRKCECECQ